MILSPKSYTTTSPIVFYPIILFRRQNFLGILEEGLYKEAIPPSFSPSFLINLSYSFSLPYFSLMPMKVFFKITMVLSPYAGVA